jgi:hypothetical protein
MINLPKETVAGPKAFETSSDVYLESSHIVVKKDTADHVFGMASMVLTVYYPKDHTFMAAAVDEQLFNTIHKGTQQLLKTKNRVGDRSIAIHELLLDNDIDTHDRNLEFVIEEGLRILKIKM